MVPVENARTPAQVLIAQLGWSSRPSGTDHVAVQTCPFCQNPNWKFYIHISGEKDGMWDCKTCGEKGNLYQLKEKLGLRMRGAVSMKDAANSRTTPAPLPNFDALHRRLIHDEEMADVLDHLVADRQFTMEVIERLKIGAEEFNGVKWFVIPYFDNTGNPVYYKARSVPPAAKQFRAPAGREAPLFNDAVLRPGMDELLIVEGEADCISLLSRGYENVVGVPGASVKKAAWIEKLDAVQPKTIYLLYDSDKVGQDNAREMGVRIGLDRVKNIVLPEFKKADGTPGKDVCEWFAAGHTLEDLEALKKQAKPFDVQGVQSVAEVLDELKQEILDKGVEPTYKTPWADLTRLMGGAEPGDLIGLMAEGKIGKTTLALNWLHWHADEYGEPALMFCMEMKPKRLVRKWVSHVTQTDDTPGKSQITPNIVDEAVLHAAQMKGDLLFGYTTSVKAENVIDTIRQAVRRYGVKIVCVDNLQLMVTSVEHSAQQTSKIAKAFKALAMELGIVILMIIQPHRVAEGQIVAARNAMGSSAIEKDVDTMICLHRNRIGGQMKEKDFTGFLQIEENFDPQMLVRVDLSRYASGGATTLWMDGARSTVREMTPDDLVTPSTPSGVGAIPVEGEVQTV